MTTPLLGAKNLLGFKTGVALCDDEALWARLHNRIATTHHLDDQTAGRILDQMFCFLQLCADNPDTPFAPSQRVDIGWDTFITYTHDYTDWCMEHAGRYIHHQPNDDPEGGEDVVSPSETAEALRQAGFVVHWDLWPEGEAAGCSTPCYSGKHEKGGVPR